MNNFSSIAILSRAVFSFGWILAFGSLAYAGPIVPKGRYCITYDHGGSDCSFTSYLQCLSMASGIDAECYGKTAQDDDDQREIRKSYARFRPSLQLKDWARREK
jgi:hypothetical protein